MTCLNGKSGVDLEENAFPICDYYIYDLEQGGVEKLLLPQKDILRDASVA